jgi:arginine decarboxylase
VHEMGTLDELARPDPSARNGDRARALTIQITTGMGTGPTKLAAFDAALADAGIANFNLIYLSSVIPTGAEIVVAEPPGRACVTGNWGDRLYVVMAQKRVDAFHEQAWAGVGWVQEPESGRGLFVEHTGANEEQVRSDIRASLAALAATRPGVDFGEANQVVRGARCDGDPICVVAVATYLAEPWTPG